MPGHIGGPSKVEGQEVITSFSLFEYMGTTAIIQWQARRYQNQKLWMAEQLPPLTESFSQLVDWNI